MRSVRLILAILAVVVLALIGFVPGSSAAGKHSTKAKTTTSFVTDQLLASKTNSLDTHVISTHIYHGTTVQTGQTTTTDGKVIPQNSAQGDGGTSSQSGCRKVTVNNVHHTLLGGTAFWYVSWTSWCWQRDPNHRIDSRHWGWSFPSSRDDEFFNWDKTVSSHVGFYYYDPGYPRSGNTHYREGHVQDCYLYLPCTNIYPANWLYSHANGTYHWRTAGTS